MNTEPPRDCARMGLSALAALCALCSLAAPAIPALAQGYPARPVTVIVPFGPGGTTDIMARLLQKSLGDEIGVRVVVENRAGASGTIGMSALARATPDGYTLGMATVGPEVIQPALRDTGYTNASFDHICGTYDVPLMMMVTRDSPFRSLTIVANYAKANPGRLSYGSSGQGTSLHLSMVMLLDRLKADALHVPYKTSGEMVTGLMGKQIMVFNETPTISTQYQLRGLAVFADKRLVNYPDVPTATELGYPVKATVWGGLIAPRGLPAPVRRKLEAACAKAVHNDAYKRQAEHLNTPLVYRDAAAFESFAAAEAKSYGTLIRNAGLAGR